MTRYNPVKVGNFLIDELKEICEGKETPRQNFKNELLESCLKNLLEDLFAMNEGNLTQNYEDELIKKCSELKIVQDKRK